MSSHRKERNRRAEAGGLIFCELVSRLASHGALSLSRSATGPVAKRDGAEARRADVVSRCADGQGRKAWQPKEFSVLFASTRFGPWLAGEYSREEDARWTGSSESPWLCCWCSRQLEREPRRSRGRSDRSTDTNARSRSTMAHRSGWPKASR